MRRRARYLFVAIISVLGFGQVITACGQKGDLYLPKPEHKAQPRQTTGAGTDPLPQTVRGEGPTKEGAATPDRIEERGQE